MAPDLAAMLTRHARSRMQQRGIPPAQIEHVLRYGRERHDRHGGVIVYLLTNDDSGSGSGEAAKVTTVVATEDVSPGDLADDLIEAGTDP